jgi:hypothetical protein
MMEVTGLRTRSILALFVVVGLIAGCGGGGGGAAASAGRADVVSIVLVDCAGTPGAIINGAFYKVTLARDDSGGVMAPGDILADAQERPRHLRPTGEVHERPGQVTATLTLQAGPLPSC